MGKCGGDPLQPKRPPDASRMARVGEVRNMGWHQLVWLSGLGVVPQTKRSLV